MIILPQIKYTSFPELGVGTREEEGGLITGKVSLVSDFLLIVDLTTER